MADSDWLANIDQLLYRIQRQDALALKSLYSISYAKILGLVVRIVNDKHEAEDVLQEVFVKVWQQSAKDTGSGSAWGWICVLARNSAIDRLRSLQKRTLESSDETPELLDQLAAASDLSDRHWLGKCLQQLKPQTREAILLSYVNGYSHSELSEKLSTPLGTVKAWVRRGLQELKQCLAA